MEFEELLLNYSLPPTSQ